MSQTTMSQTSTTTGPFAILDAEGTYGDHAQVYGDLYDTALEARTAASSMPGVQIIDLRGCEEVAAKQSRSGIKTMLESGSWRQVPFGASDRIGSVHVYLVRNGREEIQWAGETVAEAREIAQQRFRSDRSLRMQDVVIRVAGSLRRIEYAGPCR